MGCICHAAIWLAVLCVPLAAGEAADEREAFLEVQAALARDDAATVVDLAQAFRERYPESRYVPGALLAEIEAAGALGEKARLHALWLDLLARAPGSVVARTVLARAGDDARELLDDLLDAFLATGEERYAVAFRRLVPEVLRVDPGAADEVPFALPALELLPAGDARTTIAERVRDWTGDRQRLLHALVMAQRQPAEAVRTLQAHEGEHESDARELAGLLLATREVPDTHEMRLARARVELARRNRTAAAPLLDPAPETARHAYLAALALLSEGRRAEARALLDSGAFAEDRWSPELARLAEIVAQPASDPVPALLPLIRTLLAGGKRWTATYRWQGEATLVVRVFLDFGNRRWTAGAELDGEVVALADSRPEGFRFFVAGDPCIYDVPDGFELDGLRFQLAVLPSRYQVVLGTVPGTSWTDSGRLCAGLRTNPALTTEDGLRRLLRRFGYALAPRTADGITTFSWAEPAIYGPGQLARAAVSVGAGGRRVRVTWQEADASAGALSLQCGGDEVEAFEPVWPDLPARALDEVDVATLMRVATRIFEKAQG